MSLDDNLKLCIKVALEVREKVPNSSNTSWTSSPVVSTSGVAPQSVGFFSGILSAILPASIVPSDTGTVNEVTSTSLSSTVRSGGAKTMPSDSQAWWADFEEVRRKCYMHRAGNCGELSAIACLLLREAKVELPVEYVQIWDGVTQNPAIPHLVAVLGRRPNQLCADNFPVGLPDSWHADSVICDPWDRVAYPAHQYNDYWAGLRNAADAPAKLTCRLLHQM